MSRTVRHLRPSKAIPALRRRLTRKPRAHFLHLHKTGGTAIKHALRPAELVGTYHLVLHRHHVSLADLPRGEPFFFAVRDPIDRFVSSFYSRQREGGEGRPRPWRPEERRVFSAFDTPNELAESLTDPDPDRVAQAEHAMVTIDHFRSYWTWFGDEASLRARSKDLLMVLFTPTLDADFAVLTQRLGVRATLPRDPQNAHRAPPTLDRSLSDLARRNLEARYRDDFRFVELCHELR